MQWQDIYDYFIERSNGVLSDVFGMQRLCELSVTTHQTACVRGRLQDHGVIALGIHPMSGIEVVLRAIS